MELDLLSFLMRSQEFQNTSDATQFASHWSSQHVRKGTRIAQQGERNDSEIIVLDGTISSEISDIGGNAVCVGLYVGADVLAPNIARSQGGRSLVSIDATSDALIAVMDSDALENLMIESLQIRQWANGILREELARKAHREWCLAALGGAEKLLWFRESYEGYENRFVHAQIASFLGVTPVTLSRLRGGKSL